MLLPFSAGGAARLFRSAGAGTSEPTAEMEMPSATSFGRAASSVHETPATPNQQSQEVIAAALGVDMQDYRSKSPAAEGNAATKKKEEPQNVSAPLLCSIPAMANSVVGRDDDVFALWQSILKGKRLVLMVGYDGMGKSTLAQSLADAARRSSRFSCIYWFNGKLPLEPQILRLLGEVKGRKEKGVLLVIDDASDLAEVKKLMKSSDFLTVVATVSPVVPLGDVASQSACTIYRVPALKDVFTSVLFQKLVASPLSTQEPPSHRIVKALAGVPLFINMCGSVRRCKPSISDDQLCELLESLVSSDGTVSLSKHTNALVALARQQVSPDTIKLLERIALLNLAEISAVVVEALVGPSGVRCAEEAVSAGLLSPNWGGEGYLLHASVAAALAPKSSSLSAAHREVSKALLGVWPKRWRGTGATTALSLMWHAVTLARNASNMESLSVDFGLLAEQAVAFATQNDRSLRAVIPELSFAALKALPMGHTSRMRVLLELGKVLLQSDHPSASSTLQLATEEAVRCCGPESAEASLAVAYRSKYLPPSQENRALVAASAARLEGCLSNPNSAELLSRDEVRMYRECIFILLVSQGRITEALGCPVDEDLWKRMAAAHEAVTKMTDKKVNPTAKAAA